MAADGRWTLTASTHEGTLDRILDLVGEMTSSEEVDDDAQMQFELAVAEIGANIIEHAGRAGKVSLTLELQLTPDRLEARFSDDGSPARVNLRTVEMPDVMADRGRGLAIALGTLDELEYRRRDGSNQWRLVCYRRDEPVAEDDTIRRDDQGSNLDQ